MKRLCIFVTYVPDNIVDDSSEYLLRELRMVSDYLIVVCNYIYITRGIENVASFFLVY